MLQLLHRYSFEEVLEIIAGEGEMPEDTTGQLIVEIIATVRGER